MSTQLKFLTIFYHFDLSNSSGSIFDEKNIVWHDLKMYPGENINLKAIWNENIEKLMDSPKNLQF